MNILSNGKDKFFFCSFEIAFENVVKKYRNILKFVLKNWVYCNIIIKKKQAVVEAKNKIIHIILIAKNLVRKMFGNPCIVIDSY
ncbi:hypothetical protein BpHYR1_026335 [Brachionus plicatilis]|uniref:Uncharacterized protein n=1 Tax=Brachionus plicatilis TaxID=10195 RepID=A0A3M7PS52_BRAPC|nr:hypothetical protein BpHYR1_026335 [Brachionus plicatilis]